MIGTDTTFATAIENAREAVEVALDALNTVERRDSDYVLPLIDAQKALATAIRQWERSQRA